MVESTACRNVAETKNRLVSAESFWFQRSKPLYCRLLSRSRIPAELQTMATKTAIHCDADRCGLTYADYLKLPTDGRRHEIIDGRVVFAPARSSFYEVVARRLYYQLYSAIELQGQGVCLVAPVDLELSTHNIVRPDLVVALSANRLQFAGTRVMGLPDLIVELSAESPDSASRRLRQQVYRRAGVPEYWVVDPVRDVVDQMVLDSDRQYRWNICHDEVCLSCAPQTSCS